MKIHCQYCQKEFEAQRSTATFCSGACRAKFQRHGKPENNPHQVEAVQAIRKIFIAPKPKVATLSTECITGIKRSDDILFSILKRVPRNRKAISEKECHEKLKAINAYNEYQLALHQPHHCTTIFRLCEMLLEWGLDAKRWLLGEAKSIGHHPAWKQYSN